MVLLALVSLTGCDPSFNSARQESPAAVENAAIQSNDARKLAHQVESFVAAASPGNSAYQIGAQDVLEVIVFKAPELTRSVQVADGGTINLPLIGEVRAADRTAQQVEHDVAARLGAKFLNNPQVNVYVKEFNSQRFTVEGAVKMPGIYPIRGKTSLMQAIAVAQGSDRDVAASNVTVFRTHEGQRVVGQFDVDAIRAGQASDPLILSGDVIVVPTETSKVVLQNLFKVSPLLAAFRPSIL